ncbi:hypothetical protein FS749_011790 [Ceratobasidium sp. UAMH 11750]|nr:hypothetical protein FS749_011790 [Ceratobasidium sp. UAMH 11750]
MSILPAKATISAKGPLSLADIIPILVNHGCPDITSRLDTSAFSEFPLHGGGSGDVYLGQMKGGIKVAVKCARHRVEDERRRQDLKFIAREIHAWSKCNHENILALFGLAQYRGRLAIVSPWMENGTLPEYIAKEPDVDRLELCLQITHGLAYLHEQNMIHGDLKGANVLVSETGVLKLADFGNTKLKEQNSLHFSTRTGRVFSLRWAAPEILEGSPCSAPADIYALGMTIYVCEFIYVG